MNPVFFLGIVSVALGVTLRERVGKERTAGKDTGRLGAIGWALIAAGFAIQLIVFLTTD